MGIRSVTATEITCDGFQTPYSSTRAKCGVELSGENDGLIFYGSVRDPKQELVVGDLTQNPEDEEPIALCWECLNKTLSNNPLVKRLKKELEDSQRITNEYLYPSGTK